jgi:hypothetical protein
VAKQILSLLKYLNGMMIAGEVNGILLKSKAKWNADAWSAPGLLQRREGEFSQDLKPKTQNLKPINNSFNPLLERANEGLVDRF